MHLFIFFLNIPLINNTNFLKYEKSNLILIQTKDNLVITHKIDTLITLTSFLKKCKKRQRGLIYRDGGS